MIRHNRLLVTFHVISDALLGVTAFILAYAVRFQTGFIPITRGLPPLKQYVIDAIAADNGFITRCVLRDG